MRSAAFGLLLLAAAGCQLARGAGPTPESPGRWQVPVSDPQVLVSEPDSLTLDPAAGKVYQGILEIDGGETRAALQLVREGRRGLWGALQASSGLQAEGSGTIRGEEFELDLRYGGSCPGRLLLEGQWDREAEILSGVIRATDCTGPAEGTFRFSGS